MDIGGDKDKIIENLKEQIKIKSDANNAAYGFIRCLGLSEIFAHAVETGKIDILELKKLMKNLDKLDSIEE